MTKPPTKMYASPLGKLSKKQINALLLQGQRMSNWFYNSKQSHDFHQGQKAQFAEMQVEWDKIRHEEPR